MQTWRLLCGSLLILAGLVSGVRSQLTWRQIPELSYRAGHAMAYDPLRKRVVLFGGKGRSLRLGDTWEWDGAAWEPRIHRGGPSARDGMAMAYDPVRKGVTMFGGLTGPKLGVLLGETWAWDGRTWTNLKPKVAPSPRVGSAMALDPVRKRIVLFGGAVTPGIFAVPARDTWEWDGKDWIQRFPKTRPLARVSHGMAFNPKTGRVVMFGGFAGLGPFPKDTWEWDGKDWIRMSPKTNPGLRGLHGMTTDPNRGTVLLHGGMTSVGKQMDDTWTWDGSQWRRLVPSSFTMIRNSAIVGHEARKQVLSFGSLDVQKGAFFGKTWNWDGSRWTEVGDWVKPRAVTGMAYDAARDQILIAALQDIRNPTKFPLVTWVLADDGRFRKLNPSKTPLGSRGSGLVYHAGLKKVLLLGGGTGNETWLWDGQTWTQQQSQKSPRAWQGQFLTYDSHRQKVVYVVNKQTWEWDPKGWVQHGTSGPGLAGALAYDPLRKRTVWFGGYDSTNNRYLRQTWEWDGKRWQEAKPKLDKEVPPGRVFGHMAFVPSLGGVVLFGGHDGQVNPFSDAWVWDGKRWSKLSFPPVLWPRFSFLSAAAYDSGRQRVVAIGNTNVERSTWEFLFESLRVNQRYPRLGEGFTLQIQLPNQAGNPFLLALSGDTRPGIPLRLVPGVGVELLPLKADALFWLSLQANLITVLDSQGESSIAVRIPTHPALLWFKFHAAGVTFHRGGSVSFITNGVPLQIVQ